jgi:uncharacterized protein YjbI with pentapeptide repeats
MPLVDHVQSLLRRDLKGAVINLYGPPGSGKSTAIKELAAAFWNDNRLRLMDKDCPPKYPLHDSMLIFTSDERKVGTPALAMAPWSCDELIEYTLARWKDRCKSVMSRVLKDDYLPALGGNPQLWAAVLDALAIGPDYLDIRGALRRRAAHLAPSSQRHADGAALCLEKLTQATADEPLERSFPADEKSFALLLRHPPMQVLLASDMLVYLLCDSGDAEPLGQHWPPELLRETAHQLHQRDGASAILESAIEGPELRLHPVAASLLLQMSPKWRPSGRNIPHLLHAQLQKAQWQHVDLFAAQLGGADLENADLRSSRLLRAKLHKTRLSSADLRASLLSSIQAISADFTAADLSEARADCADFTHACLKRAKLRCASLRRAKFIGANLKGADFCRADLRKANFHKARLEGADFTSANLTATRFSESPICQTTLTGARLVKAFFTGCSFEAMDLDRLDFTRATLFGSLFTGASMRNAILLKADLRQTGLANVDLHGADLRKADLRGASFHLGSSRSGLVASLTPCEGSKTGFYTDERDEHHFRAPEEIRKANLCKANLRGAKIKGVDFYLVDVRGARYTRRQGKYLARSGAIMT